MVITDITNHYYYQKQDNKYNEKSFVHKKTLISLFTGITTTSYTLLNKKQASNIYFELGKLFQILDVGASKNFETSIVDSFKLLQIGEIESALKIQPSSGLSIYFNRALEQLSKIKKSPGRKHLAPLISKAIKVPEQKVKQLLKSECNFISTFSDYLKAVSLNHAIQSGSGFDYLAQKSKTFQKFAISKAIIYGIVVTLMMYDSLNLVYKTLNRLKGNE